MKMILKLLKWVLILGLILTAAGIFYLSSMGLFSDLKVYQKEAGPYTVVCERYVGPYKDTGKVFEKVYNELLADGVKTTRGLGIYYDNPAVTPQDKLRSDLGCVIEENNMSKLPMLKKKYTVKVITRKPSIVAEFPIKGTLSYMIGPIKGYPALMKYAKDNDLKWAKDAMPMEYYDHPANKIYYIIGIEKGGK